MPSQPLDVRSDFGTRPFTTVAQLVTRQVTANPTAVAVVAGNQVVTYAELEGRATKVANRLRSFGVGPDVLVGLCVERCVEMVVGALGILKSGGAYVPLDPAYPPERLAFMLNDAQPRVLLTQHSLAQQLPTGKWRPIDLDHEARVGAPSEDFTESDDLKAGDLAYVIYTSGSTGRPKGVQITQGGLRNLVLWHHRAFSVKPSDCASQLASLGFDAAGWELWPYLTAGASVHLVSDGVRNEPRSLCDWLVAHSISIAFVPTPLAEPLIALKWPPETALRTLLTGADTLHSHPRRSLPFTLVNNYGPTECTVVASSGPVLPDEWTDVPPPIGRPIDNTKIYILDKQLREVPVGTTGQICVAGAGLARGYLNARELTESKFIRNPFSSDPTARLYKTGDLGSYLPDGQIAFRGRIDEQIKIRGHRIEPAEIVAALNADSGVQASCVVAGEGGSGEKRLVAYVVPALGSQVTEGGLRNLLRKQLPEYMIPSVFVRLAALPLTPNGKVDRDALPTPTPTNPLRDEPLIFPRTLIEERLAKMLATLLAVGVGVSDNFFLLGGHSLLAGQLLAQVNDMFGIELSLRNLFEAPTVARLSAEIERRLLAKVGGLSNDEGSRILAATTVEASTAGDPRRS